MEYEHFMPLLSRSTTFPAELEVDPETIDSFFSWMASHPDLSYQYANMIYANLP